MLINEYKFKLDINKIIRYALVHDLPEVYAGDVSMHANYVQKDKDKREAQAIKKLVKQFPNQKKLWKDIIAFDLKQLINNY